MNVVVLTRFLVPFLPYLVKLGKGAGEKATEVVAEKFGEAAWKKAQKVWEHLSPKVEEKEDLKMATERIAANPDSTTWQAVLQEGLEHLLNSNQDLAEAIAKILEDNPEATPGTQINQNVDNTKGQVIGQMTGGKAIGNIDFGSVQGDVNL